MSVPAVSGASDFYANVGATRNTDAAATAAGEQTLDKDAFLQLLVASLKYQDPSAPMNTSELMAQTTQLSTMEQLVSLTTMAQQSFALQQRSSAAALVGQYVSYVDDKGKTVEGLVKSVDLTSADPLLKIGDAYVSLHYISGVVSKPADPAPNPSTSQTTSSGNTVQA
ncbi:flagellar hook capping FlgD N-terminal domain-containing protein [Georgenia ruanii]|uniref:Flagellar hook capping protein n=1 Tax=Georgenia ruanii TaxID=348442 RepID=A0A7J9UYK8_9MICO|nr:flagellar hook capping FlgD N-terminal domain-containing protein [Georgenia ruanii]MPV89718.1 flagellar hook capping protein [Georgenia ruanii]